MPFFLRTFRLRRFKAIRDSGTVRLTPFTLLIGGNGSGKSSLIEGLQTCYELFFTGPTQAFSRWRGFEHVFHHGSQTMKKRMRGGTPAAHTIEFDLNGKLGKGGFKTELEIEATGNFDRVFRAREIFTGPQKKPVEFKAPKETSLRDLNILGWKDDISPTGAAFQSSGRYWQFLNFAPQGMGQPRARTRHPGQVRLAEDGANLAEFLFELGQQSPQILQGIIQTVASVLGYGSDLQAVQTSELERVVYLTLNERDFKVPGWLLSTGTLRLVALLAVLRHPNPPALLVVEELENGLDPRTIAVVLEAIREAVEENRTQVIVTTHSPHLLNLVLLKHIVLVERNEKGEPEFRRPADDADVRRWAERFSPGDLYTMNEFKKNETPIAAEDKEAGKWAAEAKKLIK